MENNLILCPIALHDLLNQVRSIIREELKVEAKKDEEKLVGPDEAARLFVPAISPRTLWDWSRQGLIKKYRIAGRVYYKKSEIIESLTHLKRYKVKRQIA